MERTPLFILDASVAVKWFVTEQSRRKALQVRHDYVEGKIDLAAPSLLFYEVGNALRYRPGSTADVLSKASASLVDLELRTYDVSKDLSRETANLAYQYGITFYDGVYLALGVLLEGRLLTADSRLGRKLGKSASRIILPLSGYKSSMSASRSK